MIKIKLIGTGKYSNNNGRPIYKPTIKDTENNTEYRFSAYVPSLTAYNRGEKGMRRELRSWFEENPEYFELVDPNWMRCDHLKGGFN
jgi:hypothetical protein